MTRVIKFAAVVAFLVYYIFVPVSSVNAIAKERTGFAKTIGDIKKTVVFIGEFGGTVSESDFLKIKDILDPEAALIFNELIRKGYLDENGRILKKFKFYKKGFALGLNEKFEKYGKEILAILLQHVRPRFYGTGVLIEVQGIYHIITAKHVVTKNQLELNDDSMLIFFNSKDRDIAFRSIEEIKKEHGVNWIFHNNRLVDVAIMPFGLDYNKDDVLVVPDNLFQTTDRLFELYDIFFCLISLVLSPKK